MEFHELPELKDRHKWLAIELAKILAVAARIRYCIGDLSGALRELKWASACDPQNTEVERWTKIVQYQEIIRLRSRREGALLQ